MVIDYAWTQDTLLVVGRSFVQFHLYGKDARVLVNVDRTRSLRKNRILIRLSRKPGSGLLTL